MSLAEECEDLVTVWRFPVEKQPDSYSLVQDRA
jgi:hypothetical protein